MTDTQRATTAPRRSADKDKRSQDKLDSTPACPHPSPSTQLLQGSFIQEASRILLVVADQIRSQHLQQHLETIGLAVEISEDVRDAVSRLRVNGSRYDLVIVDVTNQAKPWERLMHYLQEAACQLHHQLAPLFLCVSRSRISPQLRLALERKGARLAYTE